MIHYDKIGLRPVEEEDLPLLVQWRNHPRSRAMFFTPFLISHSGQKKWYEALLNDPTRMQFMVVRLADNITIGTIGLARIDYRNQSAELGVLLTDPSERRQRLGIDGVNALLHYAFNDLNLRRVYAEVYTFNKAVLDGCPQAGFKREGVAREAAFINGKFHDVVHIAVLREEWRKIERRDTTGNGKDTAPG